MLLPNKILTVDVVKKRKNMLRFANSPKVPVMMRKIMEMVKTKSGIGGVM